MIPVRLIDGRTFFFQRFEFDEERRDMHDHAISYDSSALGIHQTYDDDTLEHSEER